MTVHTRPTRPTTRKLSLIAGVLFVITFITSIPALLLYDPVLTDPGYIVGPGADTSGTQRTWIVRGAGRP